MFTLAQVLARKTESPFDLDAVRRTLASHIVIYYLPLLNDRNRTRIFYIYIKLEYAWREYSLLLALAFLHYYRWIDLFSRSQCDTVTMFGSTCCVDK